MPSQDEKLEMEDELDDGVGTCQGARLGNLSDVVWASRTQDNESAEEQEGKILQVTVPWIHVGEACCES